MAREKPRGVQLRDNERPTEVEWTWLLAAPGYNPFLGFDHGALSNPERLCLLWARYGDEIRGHWEDHPPKTLPHGHPANREAA